MLDDENAMLTLISLPYLFQGFPDMNGPKKREGDHHLFLLDGRRGKKDAGVKRVTAVLTCSRSWERRNGTKAPQVRGRERPFSFTPFSSANIYSAHQSYGHHVVSRIRYNSPL